MKTIYIVLGLFAGVGLAGVALGCLAANSTGPQQIGIAVTILWAGSAARLWFNSDEL